MDEDPASFLKAVRLGIRGYLLKDASSAEVISAVQSVMRGEAICPPKLCATLFEFVSRQSQGRPGTASLRTHTGLILTYRQRELMTLVAAGPSHNNITAK